jgi:hypothetical protein
MRSAPCWPHSFYFVGETMKRNYPIDVISPIPEQNLITVDALHYYGGLSDLEKVYDYLENLIADKSLQ